MVQDVDVEDGDVQKIHALIQQIEGHVEAGLHYG
jgi:hypothetical protein